MDRQHIKEQDAAPEAPASNATSTHMESALRHVGGCFKVPEHVPADLDDDESIRLEEFDGASTTQRVPGQNFIFGSADIKFLYSSRDRSVIDSAYGSSESAIHNVRSWTFPKTDGERVNSISTQDDLTRHNRRIHGQSAPASRQPSPHGETDRETREMFREGRKNKCSIFTSLDSHEAQSSAEGCIGPATLPIISSRDVPRLRRPEVFGWHHALDDSLYRATIERGFGHDDDELDGMSPYSPQTSDESDTMSDSESILDVVDSSHPLHWDPTNAYVVRVKQAYWRILEDFVARHLPHINTSSPSTRGTSPRTHDGGNSPTDQDGSANARKPAKRKRPRKSSADEDTEDDEDCDDDEPKSKRIRMANGPDERKRRLACPFYKRYPEEFHECGCKDYENTSRIKQHLTKRHRQPNLCPSCHREFRDYAVMANHIRERNCETRPQETVFCVSQRQEEQLKSRSTHKTNEERWYAIFKILFPGDPLPSSPYLDADVSRDINLVIELFQAQAPAAFNRAIEETLPEHLHNAYGDDIERIMRTVSFEVFERIYVIVRRLRQQIHSPRRNAARDSGIGSNTAISPDIEVDGAFSHEQPASQQPASQFQAAISDSDWVGEPTTTQAPTSVWSSFPNEPTSIYMPHTENLDISASDSQNLSAQLPSETVHGQEFSLDFHSDLQIADQFSFTFN